MKKPYDAVIAAVVATSTLLVSPAHASKQEVICAYARSQSPAASAALAAAGSAATISAIGEAIGLTAVAHSSGAMILTGSSGYIAGTMSVATATSFIVTIGVVTAGVAAVVELMCVRHNHASQVAKITRAAVRFTRKTKNIFRKGTAAVKVRVIPASIKVREVSSDAFDHAYRIVLK